MILYSEVQPDESGSEYTRLVIKPIVLDTMTYLIRKDTTDFTGPYEDAIESMSYRLLGEGSFHGKLPSPVSLNLVNLKVIIESGFVTCENRFDYVNLSKKCIELINSYITQRDELIAAYSENPIIIDNLDDLPNLVRNHK